MSARVTMRDVAEAAGVSPMTVSRALRDDETVSARTRRRVRETAAALGYVYDVTATAFRTRRSGFVAVTLPSVNNANFADTYRGLTEALDGSQLQVLLGATNYRVDKEEALVRQLLARNPEALVLTGGHHTAATRELIRARGIPVVEMWDLPPDPLGSVVGFSNADAMRHVVTHLAGKGRRRLAFVGAQQGGDMRGAERRAGVVQAARDLGLPPVTMLDAGPAPVSMRHGAEVVRRHLADIQQQDAVVCVSDPVAFGVLSELKRQGIGVPDRIAVTGFGAFDLATVNEPAITTVDVGARRIGTEVARILDLLLSGDSGPHVRDVGARILPGGTS